MKLATCTLVLLLTGCGSPQPERDAETPASFPADQPAGDDEPAWFTEITDQTKLDFRHAAGQRGVYDLPEIAGSGGALFDYDSDGDLDVYLVNGGSTNGATPNLMFRREADGSFTDVTVAIGLDEAGYGMGTALGDVDNDGDLDLFVTNYGPDALYLNAGRSADGAVSFRRTEPSAGFDDDLWSTSACFFDYDRDGFLDLYVATYLVFDPRKKCTDKAGRPDFCGPQAFRGLRDRLYRNLGPSNGRGAAFIDVSDSALASRPLNKGLGVICADFDGDAWPDVYVANDGEKNQLWLNLGSTDAGRVFEDRALLMGAALNLSSRPEASMGVAAGDVDGDLDLDLFMTHLNRETNTLYLNLGAAGFEDRTAASGLGPAGLAYTGFGTAFFDADLDGDLDLVAVNGRVSRGAPPTWQPEEDVPLLMRDYAEPNIFFLNDGGGHFRDVSGQAGRLTEAAEVSRGLLAGDLDDDGDLDLLLTNCGGRARLFRNDMPRLGHWLRVRAIDPELRRDALGATVVVRAGGESRVRPVISTYGYLSAVEPEVHFGLGEARRVEAIQVVWPDGTPEVFPGIEADQVVELRKGEGEGS